MFKNAFALILVLLFFHTAGAEIFLIEPLERTLENNSDLDLGALAGGETLEIVVQRKSGLGFNWDSISVDSASIPAGWQYSYELKDKTLVARVVVPVGAEESVQLIRFSLGKDSDEFTGESFLAYVTVKRNLLGAGIDGLKQDTMVGSPTVFRLFVNNESIAPQRVIVESTLPSYWFEPLEIDIGPMQTKEIELFVFPRNYGQRNFSFIVFSELNGFIKPFNSELRVFSDLKGKFIAPIYGFPFFTPSLLPQFLLNSFVALFF